ncbi:hypothetical protein [Clostridium estertheticum]|nr:hypothetical protein [Clostridium estertheticum]MCB2339567.1 hypothetical protein [Clostridium estertheticum]MCB2357890.1 hypothetical protein [Clostridium estertheticum]
MSLSNIIPIVGSLLAFLGIVVSLFFMIKSNITMKRKYKEKYKRKQ